MNTAKKKICILAATPLTIHFFLKPHILALAKEFDVTLMLNLKNDAYLPPLNLPIHIIDIPIARKMSPFSDIHVLATLINLFWRTRYDLLITVVPKAGLLGMLAGTFTGISKRLHIFQGEVWANRSGFGRWILKFCDVITTYLATNLLAVSDSEKRFLETQGVVRPEKINVLGKGSIGGVNLTRFVADAAVRDRVRDSFGIPSHALVFIFVGRLVADKGIYELVSAYKQALQNYPDLWLLLVGPDEEGQWQHIQKELGVGIGQVRHQSYTEQPQEFLAAADVLCLPSHREGFGVVIIEAAAMGIPAIGSRIYGVSDAIVDGQTGLLFDCGNAKRLQECIEKLSSEPELQRLLGKNAHQNVEQYFDDQQVRSLYLSYIRELLND